MVGPPETVTAHRARWPAFTPGAVPALLVVLGMGVATYSVVRYKLWIVAAYAALVALLAWWVLHRPAPAHPEALAGPNASASAASAAARRAAWGAASALALAAVLHLQVHAYTYLKPGEAGLVRALFAVTALAAAGALVGAAHLRRGTDAALVVAVVGYLVTAALLIHLDPRPKIDVWVMLQQTADGLLHGKNMYTQNWTGSPGVQDAFTYLPFTGLLLAPGRWLAGDVRWTLVLLTLLGVLAVRLLGGVRTGGEPSAARSAATGAAALLLLLPGTSTQVEQAWTEPLLMACLAGWALGVHRRNTALAVLCLALGLASKQHLFVLLPILAAWPRFGPRRALLSAGLAGAFMLPWFIASPSAMIHDAVTVLIHFQPLLFADTLYIAAIHNLSWTPPFALTGAAILLTLVAAVITVRRRDPDLAAVLRWCALVLFVANLVNKQAFYNQYWLIAAMVVISLAVPRPAAAPVPEPAPDPQLSRDRAVRPPAGGGA